MVARREGLEEEEWFGASLCALELLDLVGGLPKIVGAVGAIKLDQFATPRGVSTVSLFRAVPAAGLYQCQII